MDIRPNFTPPFNIVRCAYVHLSVKSLAASRTFYENILGLNVTDEDSGHLYCRGMEERNHHSLVLSESEQPLCRALGYKVFSEADLELAYAYFESLQYSVEWAQRPFQGKTLRVGDNRGIPLEFCFSFESAPSLLQKYAFYKGARPLRLDHFNVFSDDVLDSVKFYNQMGFRLTEYTVAEDGEDIWAAWMHRKGNVHDVAFTNGSGPRLHHFAFWAPSALDIIHLCDVMSTTGYLENLERGPGRHGISNAFFLYVRDPDGHRVEIYTSDYQTVDPDHAPVVWSLQDTQRQTLWGAPAPRSWFEEGSEFPHLSPRPPRLKSRPIIAH